MSNASLGDFVSPVNDHAEISAENPAIDLTRFVTRQELVTTLRELLWRLSESESPIVSSRLPNPSSIVRNRRTSDDDRHEEDSRAIQALVALEMQTGKLPTMSAVSALSGICRGVMYKADRLKKFKEIYRGRKAEHRRRKNAPTARAARAGYRTTDGGLEAIDGDD